MKKLLAIVAVLAMIFCVTGTAAAFYMDFEEGLGNDGGIITGIPGVQFTTSGGETWKYADILNGSYNAHSVDTGYGSGGYNIYGYVSAWMGIAGNSGRIDFTDQNGTWFQIGVSCYTDFYLEAYDASGTLLDSAMTGSNYYGEDMAWLRVDAGAGQNIAYVILHDSGNYWTVDNMTGDMAGGIPTPEPASVLLLGFGFLGLMGIRRKS